MLNKNPLVIKDLLRHIFSFDKTKTLGIVSRVCEEWHQVSKELYKQMPLEYHLKDNRINYEHYLPILSIAKDLKIVSKMNTVGKFNIIHLNKAQKVYIEYYNNNPELCICNPLLFVFKKSLVELELYACPITLYFIQLLPSSLKKLTIRKCFIGQNKYKQICNVKYIIKKLQKLNLKYLSFHENDVKILCNNYLFDSRACNIFNNYKCLEIVYVCYLNYPHVCDGLYNILKALSESTFIFICYDVIVPECYGYDFDTEELLKINKLVSKITKLCVEGRSKGFDFHICCEDHDWNDDNKQRLCDVLNPTQDFSFDLDNDLCLEFKFATNHSRNILEKYNIIDY